MKNESEMLHFQVLTEMVLPVSTEVQDKEVVQLPVSTEMVLPVATEVQDKEVVQDMKEMWKMATGHEDDAG